MIKTGRGKRYFCRECGEEISYSRILYRASLCIECFNKIHEIRKKW